MLFTDKLKHAVSGSGSTLCVGLDPVTQKIRSLSGSNDILSFCKSVIDVTAPYCAAYKPNLAFFEALGAPGIELFHDLCNYIPNDKICIADAKRGDIGNTADQYKTAFFDTFNADAITLNPLMGFETLKPFLDNAEKGIYVLTLTSNPGASDFFLKPFAGYAHLCEYIAASLADLQEQTKGSIGMVTGATYAKNITALSRHFPQSGLLIPGVGTQGGNIRALSLALKHHQGIPLINVTRSIIYPEASNNWKSDIKNKAAQYRDQLQEINERYV